MGVRKVRDEEHVKPKVWVGAGIQPNVQCEELDVLENGDPGHDRVRYPKEEAKEAKEEKRYNIKP